MRVSRPRWPVLCREWQQRPHDSAGCPAVYGFGFRRPRYLAVCCKTVSLVGCPLVVAGIPERRLLHSWGTFSATGRQPDRTRCIAHGIAALLGHASACTRCFFLVPHSLHRGMTCCNRFNTSWFVSFASGGTRRAGMGFGSMGALSRAVLPGRLSLGLRINVHLFCKPADGSG